MKNEDNVKNEDDLKKKELKKIRQPQPEDPRWAQNWRQHKKMKKHFRRSQKWNLILSRNSPEVVLKKFQVKSIVVDGWLNKLEIRPTYILVEIEVEVESRLSVAILKIFRMNVWNTSNNKILEMVE